MKLETSEPDESVDDIAYETAETAWKDFGATEEARYPRARLEGAIRKALADRAPPLQAAECFPEINEAGQKHFGYISPSHRMGETRRAPGAAP